VVTFCYLIFLVVQLYTAANALSAARGMSVQLKSSLPANEDATDGDAAWGRSPRPRSEKPDFLRVGLLRITGIPIQVLPTTVPTFPEKGPLMPD